jgi:dTDP-4-amino-4,6-dideoxygalactose transaminase
MAWKIQLFRLDFGEDERQAVEDVIRSGWLTMGERTLEFENQFSRYLGAGVAALAVSSGTAALHMAMLALGIAEDDEVIVSALTFIADANVVRMVGAHPVLADCISKEDWNLDPEDVRRKITSKTRAVIAVHYAGYPCRMNELTGLCKESGIALVEDCAHAVGSTYGNRKCGTFGDIACFSFFTNKNLSVGEGGMFVSRSEKATQAARLLRSHGMNSLTLDRHEGRAISYDVIVPGLNYRIDEIRAALGMVQLRKLGQANERRRKVAEQYDELLSEVEGVSVPFLSRRGPEPCYHIYPILLERGVDRHGVIVKLRERGVQSSIHYPAIQSFTAYAGDSFGEVPLADEIASRELTLPMYPGMAFQDVEYVVVSLKESLT